MNSSQPEGAWPSGFKLLHTLRGAAENVCEVTWSPNGRLLATASSDHSIRIWDGQTSDLLQTLKSHSSSVYEVAWSPNGQILASGSTDNTVCLWDGQNGELLRTLEGHSNDVGSLEWSPDSQLIASGSRDQTVRVWKGKNGKLIWTLGGHRGPIYDLAWSPDGQQLASASFDKTIRIWDMQSGIQIRALEGHGGAVTSVAWSPDGKTIASGFLDNTIHLWNAETGRQEGILESHTDIVLCIRYSPDGQLLASKSYDGTVCLWRCDTWNVAATLPEATNVLLFGGLAFHPDGHILASLGEEAGNIRIWQLDYETLFSLEARADVLYYRNAKVVLMGDTGVGKSGLALVLTEQAFQPTESTHGRRVWTFSNEEATLPNGQRETRETLLWDLAGQPGYRLIHQLYLNEVVVALVVFDARSEEESLGGVQHWDRALRQAYRLHGDSTWPLKKFLVVARSDRGGIPVSRKRIDTLLEQLGFEGFFETSAREGWQIPELIAAIRETIQWVALPKVSSNELFQTIKQFLVHEKQAGRVLTSSEDLYRLFCRTYPNLVKDRGLRAKFDTCIGRVENRGLISRLSFGGYVLLQPELLDSYASGMINTAKGEIDGRGCLSEEDALLGRFRMPADERVADTHQEKLLLIATVEELLWYELALKEVSNSGTVLVFPSQITREYPNSKEISGKSVIYRFEGAMLNIYVSLVIRLSQSSLFLKKDHWKNVSMYTSVSGGTCGIDLQKLEEGLGELTIFFDEDVHETARYQFEDYVAAHLHRLALPNTVQRRRIIVCRECGEPIPDSMLKRLRERGRTSMACPICAAEISLQEDKERPVAVDPDALAVMDQAADARRERDTAAMVLKGKIESGAYDVFLCHNSQDKAAVKQVGEQLKERGILPWLDEWEFRPGLAWQKRLESQIEHIKSAAVFIGPNGRGPWQDLELDAFLRMFVHRQCPVIPALLPGCRETPKLPLFLEGMMWVDFRQTEPNPLEQLTWGITGEKEL